MSHLKKENVRYVIYLHLLMFFYSMGTVCSKLASGYQVLSVPFIFFYAIGLLIVGIYAILWQQVLKKISLVTAYANKAVTVVWGMIWGIIFFKEQIHLNQIIGAAIIILGVCFVVLEEEN